MSTLDPRALRQTLGQFATGVVIVTSRAPDGHAVGLTINSFSSVSLEPPLVLFSLAKSSLNHDNFMQAESYGINILAQGQRETSDRFARRSGADKWEGVAMQEGLHGTPLIAGALAHMVCTPWSQCEGGDHTVFIARVEQHEVSDDVQPLLFFRGRYRNLKEENLPMQAAWFDTLI